MPRPLYAVLTSLLVGAFGAPALAQNWVDLESQEECLADQGNVRLRIDSYGA